MRSPWIAALPALALSFGALAQDAEPVASIPVPQTEKAPASEPPADAPTQLDDIVVTATKRSQSVRQITGTINAFTGEDLEKSGAQGLDDIVKLSPGVTMTSESANPPRVTIRGVAADIGGNLTTGVLIGDVPFSDLYLPRVTLDPNPFDMATVEILKGPQGTLFGGSGLNGAIRYVPEKPQFDEMAVKYFAQYNAYPSEGGAAPTYGAVLNAPIVEGQLALRILGFKREAPGYIDNTRTGVDDANKLGQDGMRAILGWRPADNWNVSLMHIRQTTDVEDIGYSSSNDGSLEHDNEPRQSRIKTHYDLTNLGIERQFSWGDVVSQTSVTNKTFQSYLDGSRALAGGRIPTLALPVDNHSEGVIQEVRLVSADDPDSRWKWLVGGFGNQVRQYDCLDFALTVPLGISLPIPIPVVSPPACPGLKGDIGNSPNLGHFETELTATEYAVFGEVSRKLGEKWEVTAGGRYYRAQTKGQVTTAGALYATGSGKLESTAPASISEPGFSPKLVLSYTQSRELMTYVSASRGFRFGGIQATGSTSAQVPPTFKSDTLWNYEWGVRSSWFENVLIADATAYYIDWKNPQLYQKTRDGLTAFFDNVGGAKGRGVETQLQLRPPVLHGVSLGVSAAFNETVTTKEFTTAKGTDVASGSAWPSSPKWQLATTLGYQNVFGDVNFGTSLVRRYTAKAYSNLDHAAEIFGYSTLDFQVSASSISLAWLPEISLSATNLTDKRGVTSIDEESIAAGLSYTDMTYIPPRALMVRLSGKF